MNFGIGPRYTHAPPDILTYQSFVNHITTKMPKDVYLKKILGPERLDRIKSSKVVMVGAGGIGCELLKDLLLTGFGEIHIVDLDTITLSNLNRQFLFRQKDIDKLKSLTIAQAVQSFNFFGSKLVPHHGNVMDTNLFPLKWWSQFDYIYNALDNLEARRYVNKMALFLQTPLMESGTTGFEGQIQPIYPYSTECFECQPKATPQTFPVCTIRSTPSQPVHCIVWAKEFLFTQLFDETLEKEVNKAELSKETDDQEEIDRIILQANELYALKKLVYEDDFSFKLITKIYKDDVEKSMRLESLWKHRTPPKPLDFDGSYKKDLLRLINNTESERILTDDTLEWSVLENIYVLHKATEALQKRIRSGGQSIITFDKDDEDTLNFVSAAANLRSHVFHIPLKTKFDIKQIAGNIIPAIATTNAIISGFSNLGSLLYFSSGFLARDTKSVFISIKPNKRITSALVEGPNPKCASSGISKAILSLTKNDFDMTLQDLVNQVTAKYGYPGDISVILGKSRLIYDFDFDDNAEKKLREIQGLVTDEVLLFQDEEEELENLELYIQEVDDNGGSALPDLQLRARVKFTEPESESDEEMGTTTIVLDDEPPSKKRKTNGTAEDMLIIL